MANQLEKLLSITLTGAAVLIAATFAHREFFDNTPASRPVVPLTYDSHWSTIVESGKRMGSASAPITIAEFSDYECPFCKRFQLALSRTQEKFGDTVSVVFVHVPIPTHRFASKAARVAECADRYDKFEEMTRLLFEKQDSLGLKPWNSFAIGAGIVDTANFGRCTEEITDVPRIIDGTRLARSIGVNGTPTIFVNGWRFAQPPNADALADVIHTILAGKKPG